MADDPTRPEDAKPGQAPPGMPRNAAAQAEQHSQARAAMEATPPPRINQQAQAKSQQAIQQGQTLQSGGPEQTPQWRDNTQASPHQQTMQAGQTLNDAGVTTGHRLSPDAQAQMKAALDKGGSSSPPSATPPPDKPASPGAAQAAPQQSTVDATAKTGQNAPSRTEAARQSAASAPAPDAPAKSMSK